MGSLKRVSDGQYVPLNGRCLIGRSPACHLVLDDARVSAEHAVVVFTGGRWWVRDLSSTNGTFVDGSKVEQETPLSEGSALVLGHTDLSFVLIEAGPPSVEITDRQTGSVHLIPSPGGHFPEGEQTEAAYLFRTDDGWMLEAQGICQLLSQPLEYTIGRRAFGVRPPLGTPSEVGETVATSKSYQPLALRFQVSPDEEHVSVDLSYSGKERHLGHRSYSYLLLTLARARCQEEQRAVSPGEAGWIDVQKLARGLRITPEHLNLWVWRARRQVQEIDEELPALIVERRPRARTLRLGTSHVTIEQG